MLYKCVFINCLKMIGILDQLRQPRLWFITGGYLVKRWFIPAAARARGQSNDLNRGILASNLFNCHKEVINAHPVPSISRCIHIVYRHKNVWEYQWSNFIYNCMSTFLHYVHCKDALLDCSAPGGERCESLTWVDEIRHNVSSQSKVTNVIFFIISLHHYTQINWTRTHRHEVHKPFTFFVHIASFHVTVLIIYSMLHMIYSFAYTAGTPPPHFFCP